MIQPIFEMYQCFGNITVNTDFGDKELLGDILLPLLRMQTNFWKQLCTPEYFTDTDGNACYLKGKKSLNDCEKYLIIPSYLKDMRTEYQKFRILKSYCLIINSTIAERFVSGQ